MPTTNARFEEGQPCPVKVMGGGGGLSASPSGDLLLIGAFPSPSQAQVEAWGGKWRAKLVTESEFPAIPIFAVGNEDWILEAPSNPSTLEMESPGFCEALYAKDHPEMVAILVDSDTNCVKKIKRVVLDEMFVERMVLSWNPFRHKGDQYSKSFTDSEFAQRIQEIFKLRTSRQLWTTSW